MTDEKDEFDPADWLAQQLGSPPPLTERPAAAPAPSLPPVSPEPAQPVPVVPPASPPAQPAPVVPPATPPASLAPAFDPLDQPTQAMDASEFRADLAAFEPPPVESSLAGGVPMPPAHEVGLREPESEGLAHSPLDALFGETQFRDYVDEPLIPATTVRQQTAAVTDAAPAGQHTGITPMQKKLMWIVGGLVAALAIVALFLVGTRIAGAFDPAPVVTAAPTPTATPTALPIVLGPVAPGDSAWDALLGGECLEPYESPWQDEYTVVECTEPHAGQLIGRGQFAEIDGSTYPGFDVLASRISLLCSAPALLDYSQAGLVNDLQVEASFAVDAAEWSDGNRSYSCFVSRAGGEPLTGTVAMPQVAPVPEPTPTA